MKILTIGEILWDVFEKAEFIGGAPLNFSAAAQRLGNDVLLISAVGEDERGRRALEAMKPLGLPADFISVVTERDTGTALVIRGNDGNASYLIPRPVAFDDLVLDEAQISQLKNISAGWIYFGSLAQANETNEFLVRRLVAELPGIKCFYDINLREGHWNLSLVQRLSALASILKLNEEEAKALYNLTQSDEFYSLEAFCRYWSLTYDIEVICVTRGRDGCAIFTHSELRLFAGFPTTVVDTVGAGDAFAAAFLHGHVLGWKIERQAAFANALGSLVASRAGAIPPWSQEECVRLAESRTKHS